MYLVKVHKPENIIKETDTNEKDINNSSSSNNKEMPIQMQTNYNNEDKENNDL